MFVIEDSNGLLGDWIVNTLDQDTQNTLTFVLSFVGLVNIVNNQHWEISCKAWLMPMAAPTAGAPNGTYTSTSTIFNVFILGFNESENNLEAARWLYLVYKVVMVTTHRGKITPVVKLESFHFIAPFCAVQAYLIWSRPSYQYMEYFPVAVNCGTAEVSISPRLWRFGLLLLLQL